MSVESQSEGKITSLWELIPKGNGLQRTLQHVAVVTLTVQ
jgi:hypothetical protein